MSRSWMGPRRLERIVGGVKVILMFQRMIYMDPIGWSNPSIFFGMILSFFSQVYMIVFHLILIILIFLDMILFIFLQVYMIVFHQTLI